MSMKCLIIAAGKGSRLRHKSNSKPLIPILGVPLIERVIRCALAAGADDFYVVIGYQGERVRVFLNRLRDRLAARGESRVESRARDLRWLARHQEETMPGHRR